MNIFTPKLLTLILGLTFIFTSNAQNVFSIKDTIDIKVTQEDIFHWYLSVFEKDLVVLKNTGDTLYLVGHYKYEPTKFKNNLYKGNIYFLIDIKFLNDKTLIDYSNFEHFAPKELGVILDGKYPNKKEKYYILSNRNWKNIKNVSEYKMDILTETLLEFLYFE